MGDYKITVLEIGYAQNVPSAFYLGDFCEPDVTYPVHPFSMTYVEGNGHKIMIDTGIDTSDPVKVEILKEAGIVNSRSPKEVLAQIGVSPDEIDTVILTHAHFDHAGGVDCYPNARFYLQSSELSGWSEYCLNDDYTAIGCMSVDKGDIARLKNLAKDGRLELLEGDKTDIIPGISLITAGFGHTFGLQMVAIETQGTVMLHVSDLANRPENFLGTKSFPHFIPNTKFGAGSPFYALCDYERVMNMVHANLDRIIMTHDGSRREKFPEAVGELGLGVYKLVR